LGYFPGTLHALYLVYKQMQAEERYGQNGFTCASDSLYISMLRLLISCIFVIDIGNGQYEPRYHDVQSHQQHHHYGATSV
jgi:hypothetical protein